MNSNTAKQPLFNTILSIQSFDNVSLVKAKDIFKEYSEKGVFRDCVFECDVWHTTDEYSNIGIRFNFEKFSYKRFYEPIFGITYESFVDYVKAFVAFTMGKNVLKTLQTAINDLKRLVRTAPEDIYGATADLKIAVPSLCIDFLSVLPESQATEKVEALMDSLDIYASISFSRQANKQRDLAQFDSYFLFNDIINDFWMSDMDNDTRLFYYPLFLWWQITGVIPLRPREFILTKRDCLVRKEDGYYLILRRNNLKGGEKQVSYRIEDDYYEVTYKIPDKLANEILQYKKFTKKYDDTQIETLFISDTHYQHWRQKKHLNSRYFTYINMNTVMRYFFHEVIERIYGLKTVYEREAGHLHEGEINYLHLGDTRHLALINIMAEGGTPVTAMLLAGHNNVEMAAHYYSNITNLIECRTYRQYRLVTKGEVSYQVSLAKKVPVKDDSYTILSDGGRCYSENYQNGDISNCIECAGPSGELSYCPDCRFYRKKGRDYFSTDSTYKRSIKDDCKALAETIRIVRAGKGNEEDIGEALLKLASSSYTYQEYYKLKAAKLESEGKDIWEEKK